MSFTKLFFKLIGLNLFLIGIMIVPKSVSGLSMSEKDPSKSVYYGNPYDLGNAKKSGVYYKTFYIDSGNLYQTYFSLSNRFQSLSQYERPMRGVDKEAVNKLSISGNGLVRLIGQECFEFTDISTNIEAGKVCVTKKFDKTRAYNGKFMTGYTNDCVGFGTICKDLNLTERPTDFVNPLWNLSFSAIKGNLVKVGTKKYKVKLIEPVELGLDTLGDQPAGLDFGSSSDKPIENICDKTGSVGFRYRQERIQLVVDKLRGCIARDGDLSMSVLMDYPMNTNNISSDGGWTDIASKDLLYSESIYMEIVYYQAEVYDSDIKYSAKELNKFNYGFDIEGYSDTIYYKAALTTSTYNTPSVYIENSDNKTIKYTINSQMNDYINQEPAFNVENGWEFETYHDQITVDNKSHDSLFYELNFDNVILNRNGKNFLDKDSLFEYLENSDIYTKLGFDEQQKNNSIDYMMEKLDVEANNYYLTILSDNSINNISDLDIEPKPEQLERKYLAVYPSDMEVKTEGDFLMPDTISINNKFTVKEYGEIIVYPGMTVFWE